MTDRTACYTVSLDAHLEGLADDVARLALLKKERARWHDEWIEVNTAPSTANGAHLIDYLQPIFEVESRIAAIAPRKRAEPTTGTLVAFNAGPARVETMAHPRAHCVSLEVVEAECAALAHMSPEVALGIADALTKAACEAGSNFPLNAPRPPPATKKGKPHGYARAREDPGTPDKENETCHRARACRTSR